MYIGFEIIKIVLEKGLGIRVLSQLLSMILAFCELKDMQRIGF